MESQRNTVTKLRLDVRITAISLVILMVITVPAMYVHELGHAVVCQAQGHRADIYVDIYSAVTTCYGDVGSGFGYKLMGGAFAFIVFTFTGLHRSTKGKPWLYIPLISVGIGHGINAIIETAFYESYINGDPIWVVVMGVASYIIFFGLLIKYGRK